MTGKTTAPQFLLSVIGALVVRFCEDSYHSRRRGIAKINFMKCLVLENKSYYSNLISDKQKMQPMNVALVTKVKHELKHESFLYS